MTQPTSKRYPDSTYLGYTVSPVGRLQMFNSAHAIERQEHRSLREDVLSMVLDGVMNGACENEDLWSLLSGWSKKAGLAAKG